MSDKDGRHRCVSNVTGQDYKRYFCIDCGQTTNDNRGTCNTITVEMVRAEVARDVVWTPERGLHDADSSCSNE